MVLLDVVVFLLMCCCSRFLMFLYVACFVICCVCVSVLAWCLFLFVYLWDKGSKPFGVIDLEKLVFVFVCYLCVLVCCVCLCFV